MNFHMSGQNIFWSSHLRYDASLQPTPGQKMRISSVLEGASSGLLNPRKDSASRTTQNAQTSALAWLHFVFTSFHICQTLLFSLHVCMTHFSCQIIWLVVLFQQVFDWLGTWKNFEGENFRVFLDLSLVFCKVIFAARSLFVCKSFGVCLWVLHLMRSVVTWCWRYEENVFCLCVVCVVNRFCYHHFAA